MPQTCSFPFYQLEGSMTVVGAGEGDPVPLGHRFDVVWRGYDRRQVAEYLEVELRTLTEDRDAATELVCDLARLLDETRGQVVRLRERYNELCLAPLSSGAVDARLRRRVEIAQAEASNIVMRARVRAEHILLTAAEEAGRETDAAARRRHRVEEDFRIAMAARRAEVMHDLRAHEAACRADAERLVRDAQETAVRQVAAATAQVESLRQVQRRLAHRLRSVRGLFLRTYALADPMSPVLGEELDARSVRP
jgi:colicin import membrane protein